MKPFDLEAAKRGEPVITRREKNARIICFDRRANLYPIIALVEDDEGIEQPKSFKLDGGHAMWPPHPHDLFMR